jgi:DNA-binding winged helix-turn-helix (wHTH) protein
MTATTHCLGPCEIDEARRTLSAHGQEIHVQPRVFDLLCYLVRHRDRVVAKDELLDALWPGTVVVDSALQRVVSLARSALAEAGLSDAVRTYPRHGYRFCFDDGTEPPAAAVPTDAVTEARAASARSDWTAACDAYEAAQAHAQLSADDVLQWGRSAICAGRGPGAARALENLVAQCDAAGDSLGATRALLLLVQIRIDQKQAALARGLLQRAARYLEGQAPCAERGDFAWMSSRMALGSGDIAHALAMADEACNIGRQLRNADVECLGLVYRGHALLAQGQVAQGLAQQEEAAAVIRLGGVRSWVAGWALCSILYAARYRCDWSLAAQFADVYTEWSRVSRMPAFPGTCQLHRAAVLGVQGELERAASEVRAAASMLASIAPWAEGDAYCVLGDIQVSHGDLEGAESSFRRAHALGWDPQPGLARLHLLTGRPQLAQRGLERALMEADWSLRERRGQLLCLLVQAAVAAGDIESAREALRTLDSDSHMLGTEALKAMHCVAEADLAMADGDLAKAVHKLRLAVRHWREVGSPVGETEARLRLAECLLRDRDAAGAELELHAMESSLAAVTLAHRKRLNALHDTLSETQLAAAAQQHAPMA